MATLRFSVYCHLISHGTPGPRFKEVVGDNGDCSLMALEMREICPSIFNTEEIHCKRQKMSRREVAWFYIHSRKYALPHALRGNEWFLDFSWISSPRTSTKTDIDLVFCQSFFLFHLKTINSVAKATKTREQLPRYQVQPSYTKHTTFSIRWNFFGISLSEISVPFVLVSKFSVFSFEWKRLQCFK